MARSLFVISLILFVLGCETTNSSEPMIGEPQLSSYTELHRPQFHFSPDSMWMNDPNGMVFFEGEYHLFYQFYPDSNVWGPMHWGHAVSSDMVHWEHLPIALYPDSLGLIFSGSAVIDWQNSSGLGENGQPPMVAIFTHHNMEGEKAEELDFQVQSIAYSNDKGRSWTKYDGNPVIPNPGIKDFRDPKVIWHEGSQHWVMVFAAYDRVRIYTSPNLRDWEYRSEFGIAGDNRLWECPDLFPLKVEETGETKWVLIVSIQKEAPNGGTATGYFVGDFDGKAFMSDPGDLEWLDHGTDNYALVTWSDIPEEDGRRLALGWMSNWQYAQLVPTTRWRSAMTLPRELTLHQVEDDFEVWSMPVSELTSLEGPETGIGEIFLSADQRFEIPEDPDLTKLTLRFGKPLAGKVMVSYSNVEGEELVLGYSADDQQFFIDRTHAGISDFQENFGEKVHVGPAGSVGEELELMIYLDRSSVEMFANGGQRVMTDIVFPSSPYSKVELVSEGTNTTFSEVTVQSLDRIWE